MGTIDKILELFYTLKVSDQKELLVKLQTINDKEDIQGIQTDSCPHCQGRKIVKNGSVKGRMRYRCRDCKKSFGNLTNTVFGHIKEMDKFLLFKKILFQEGILPLKVFCSRVEISTKTAFDWRHKLMGGVEYTKVPFENETQMDDIWEKYSQKGRRGLKYSRERGTIKKSGDNDFQVKILTATNKSQTVMKVARIGRITKLDIAQSMGDLIDANTKLISDAHPSIVGYAKENNIKHVFFKTKDHVAKTGENVQLLNAQALHLDTILNRVLRGVSTKYLDNYTNAFGFLATNKDADTNSLATILLMRNKKGWDDFTTKETHYKAFIENHSERTYRCPVTRNWKANNWNC